MIDVERQKTNKRRIECPCVISEMKDVGGARPQKILEVLPEKLNISLKPINVLIRCGCYMLYQFELITLHIDIHRELITSCPIVVGCEQDPLLCYSSSPLTHLHA